MARTNIIALRSDSLDENERLKHDVKAYFGRAQEQASTSIGHDQLVLRSPETDNKPRDLPALFDDEDNVVLFDDTTKGLYLEGTQYNALDGNDSIVLPSDEGGANHAGYNWNEILYGGDGNDHITGYNSYTSPDFKIDGGNGNDTIYGDYGDDIIWGGAGIDILSGGAASDIIYGGDDKDYIHGDAGNLASHGGNDILIGDAGNDQIFGEAKNDILVGGIGADLLIGGSQSDQLYGGDGDDNLIDADFNLNDGVFSSVDDGQDILNGGNGNDGLLASAYDYASDLMIGGSGNDTFILAIQGPHSMYWTDLDVIVDFENGLDTISLKSIDGTYFDSFEDLNIIDVNGNSYIFGKENNIPIVIVQNAAGFLDVSDFAFG